ncbi:aminoglycoside adenylyltransferase domain-containing protein [Cumulibacter soli]|uniref:aminoglycoside adenylyltransferase domain-containing protein n=1 Tax=Cumulibacter soli TaxID=2546344 RepID=UPI001068C826|nr:aminoglycoside adenylyltransferase domain-containing protein [Cumulibacter soli]
MDASIRTVLSRILSTIPENVIGAYLYGSSTTTGLSVGSDIDLLVVTGRSLTSQERTSLTKVLLAISGWEGHARQFPDAAHRRPWDVTCVVAAESDPLQPAPWRDYQYGEWLRSEFVVGAVPRPQRDPDVVILLATALTSHRVLYGPPLNEVIDDVPAAQLRQAQLAVLPALIDGLRGDERNVLLTLARAYCTVQSGDVVPKPVAAEIAAQLVNDETADVLHLAAREYRGEVRVDWDREHDRVSRASGAMLDLIRQAADR